MSNLMELFEKLESQNITVHQNRLRFRAQPQRQLHAMRRGLHLRLHFL